MLIYIFAEERSGSTWLTDQIALRLKRHHYYIESRKENFSDDLLTQIVQNDPATYANNKNVYQTHRFQIIDSLKYMATTPVVIRTTRHNKLEQMLSYFFMAHQRQRYPDWWMLPHSYTPRFDEVLRNTLITVEKEKVNQYLEKKAERDRIWAEYPRPKQTIYYEDLFEDITIDPFGIKISFQDESDYKKLEYEKVKHFTNLEEIQGWLNT